MLLLIFYLHCTQHASDIPVSHMVTSHEVEWFHKLSTLVEVVMVPLAEAKEANVDMEVWRNSLKAGQVPA